MRRRIAPSGCQVPHQGSSPAPAAPSCRTADDQRPQPSNGAPYACLPAESPSSGFFEQCPHRMACAKCDFYTPKDSGKAQLLEAKENLQKMRAVIPLTEDEQAAVDDGSAALDRLLDRLADTPTPVPGDIWRLSPNMQVGLSILYGAAGPVHRLRGGDVRGADRGPRLQRRLLPPLPGRARPAGGLRPVTGLRCRAHPRRPVLRHAPARLLRRRPRVHLLGQRLPRTRPPGRRRRLAPHPPRSLSTAFAPSLTAPQSDAGRQVRPDAAGADAGSAGTENLDDIEENLVPA